MKVDVWYKVPVMQEGDLDGWDGGFGGRSKREDPLGGGEALL